MPRPEINDYVFYKIICDDLPEYVYIGSTGCFSKRKGAHKGRCNNPNRKNYKCKLYQTIRDNGGWDKWQMVIIDKLDQTTLLDARIKEEALMKEYNGNLNSQKAYRSVEEAKEYEKEHKKEHYELNKKTINEKRNEKMTCKCGAIVRKDTIKRHEKTLKHQQFCQPIV
tara:strand:+ start:136 stop:639 length:504 start_codon:yes stop_codon:yes gene_type:complete